MRPKVKGAWGIAVENEADGIEERILQLNRPAFWNRSYVAVIVGLVAGLLLAALGVALSSGGVPKEFLLFAGGMVLLFFLLSTALMLIFRPKSDFAIEFNHRHLILPNYTGFSKAGEIEYSDILSVVVRGMKNRQYLLIDTRERLFTYPLRDLKGVSYEQFLDILAGYVNSQPGGDENLRRLEGRNLMFYKLGRRKGAVVWGLCGILAAVFLIEIRIGAVADYSILFDMGGNSPLLVSSGQWFRLFTGNFLHLNPTHFFVNLMMLAIFGLIVERLMGWQRFVIIYLVSALGGAVASALVSKALVSVGASTGIYGLLGALAVFNIKYFNELPAGYRTPKKNWILFVGLSILLAFLLPQIDNAAHVGGLLAGVVMTFLLMGRSSGPVVSTDSGKRLLPVCVFLGGLFLWAGQAGISHFNTNDQRDFVRIAEKYMAREDATPGILNNVAWSIVTRAGAVADEVRLAEEMAEKAVNLDSDEHEYLDTLATAYYRSGKIDDAVMTERKALALSNNKRGKFYATQLLFFLSSKSSKQSSASPSAGQVPPVEFKIDWVGNPEDKNYRIDATLNGRYTESLVVYAVVRESGETVGLMRFVANNPQQKQYHYDIVEDDNSQFVPDLPHLESGSSLEVLMVDTLAGFERNFRRTWRFWRVDRRAMETHRKMSGA